MGSWQIRGSHPAISLGLFLSYSSQTSECAICRKLARGMPMEITDCDFQFWDSGRMKMTKTPAALTGIC